MSTTIAVHVVDGHPDVIDFVARWEAAWDVEGDLILVTSVLGLLHGFCMGCVQMHKVTLLVLHDLSEANGGHPYCVLMEQFYAAKLAQAAIEESLPMQLPRIVGFIAWPRRGVDDSSFQARIKWMGKLQQYQRTFLGTIVPCDFVPLSDNKGQWMNVGELGDLNSFPQSTLYKGRLLYFEHPTQVLEKMKELLQSERGTQLIVSDSEHILSQGHPLRWTSEIFMAKSKALSVDWDDKNVFSWDPKDDLQLLEQALSSGQLSRVIICQASSVDPAASLVLLRWAQYVHTSFLLCVADPTEMVGRNCFLKMWLKSHAGSSELQTEASGTYLTVRPLTRLDIIGRGAIWIRDESQYHLRIPATGAMLNTTVATSLLLAFCSYLPKIYRGRPSRLATRTIPIRRVDEQGVPLGQDRQYFITIITLPRCLEEFCPPESLVVRGPICTNRAQALTSAAMAALKQLRGSYGLLSDHLVPTRRVLDFIERYQEEGIAISSGKPGCVHNDGDSELGGIAEDGVIKELVPAGLQYGPAWEKLELALWESRWENQREGGMTVAPAQLPSSQVGSLPIHNVPLDLPREPEILPPQPLFDLYLYAIECECGFPTEMDQKVAGVGGEKEGFRFPLDTFIHSVDMNFLSPSISGHSMALLSPVQLPQGLLPLQIPQEGTLRMRVRLGSGHRLQVTKAQLKVLIEFQVFLFSAINVRPVAATGVAAEQAVEALTKEDDSPVNDWDQYSQVDDCPKISNDKRTAYLVAYIKRPDSGNFSDFFLMDNIMQNYRTFLARPFQADTIFNDLGEDKHERKRNSSNNNNDCSARWELDWELMNKAIANQEYRPLDEVVVELFACYEECRDALPPAPSFVSVIGQEPVEVDFILYALRRLIIHVPHNGIFYRIKKWHYDLGPQSPFESKSLKDCRTFADYLEKRYGLHLTNPERMGLAGAKRVENFANIRKWTSLSEKKKGGGSSQRRRNNNSKSVVIPEVAHVVPFPYVLLRVALLVPHVVSDLERQLLICDFFQERLPRLHVYTPHLRDSVQSLTGPAAGTGYDYERMEILGDSLLKIFTTIDTFCNYETWGEGALSVKRQKLICNFNLYIKSIKLDLPLYARLTPFLPRIFTPPEIDRLLVDGGLRAKWPLLRQLFDGGVLKWKLVGALDTRASRRLSLHYLTPDGRVVEAGQLAHDPHPVKYRQNEGSAKMPVVTRFGVAVPPKSLADLMESIICAYYLGPGGLQAVQELLIELGLVTPQILKVPELPPLRIATRRWDIQYEANALWSYGRAVGGNRHTHSTGAGASTIFSHDRDQSGSCILNQAMFPFEEVEKKLGHKFGERRLLLLACTHASADTFRCNERLEWLGDAALDWVVTRHYYESFDDAVWMTPARITNARQAAVCNEAFARIVVHWGLDKFLRLDSPHLQAEIEAFAEAWAAFSSSAAKPPTIGLPPAPKTLGDFLEALAGAVLIDVRFSIPDFERVFLPLIRFYLDTFANPYDLPDNPIQQFWHSVHILGVPGPIDFEFQSQEEMGVEKSAGATVARSFLCRILIQGQIVAEAAGTSRNFARINAARVALQFIQSKA